MLKLFWGQKKQKIRKMMNRFWKIFEFFDEIGKFGDAEILTNNDVEDETSGTECGKLFLSAFGILLHTLIIP